MFPGMHNQSLQTLNNLLERQNNTFFGHFERFGGILEGHGQHLLNIQLITPLTFFLENSLKNVDFRIGNVTF